MRLLSYNIHKGVGARDRQYRLYRIMEVVRRMAPDFCCLQEVTRRARRYRFDHQPQLLAQAAGLESMIFQLNVHYQTGGYGNLLLSRWPMVEHHHVSLQLARKKMRGAQLAVIETPQGQLQVVNWHLGLAEKERQWQAERLLGHHLFRARRDVATLIAGDSNDWRNTLDDGPMARAGLTQVTRPISRYRTFPAWLPVGSLDKAFACPKIKVRRTRVLRSRLTREASDHLPLVIDFELSGS